MLPLGVTVNITHTHRFPATLTKEDRGLVFLTFRWENHLELDLGQI